MTQRREFLKFLAASPLLTNYSAFAQEVEQTLGQRLTDPSEVINVFEMEAIRSRENSPCTLRLFIHRCRQRPYSAREPRRLLALSNQTSQAG